MARSAEVMTVLSNVAVLLAPLRSGVMAVTVAVLLRTVPLASLASMLRVYTNVTVLPAVSVVSKQLIGPLGPVEQIVQLVAAPKKAKVAPAGIESLSDTLW